MDLQQNHNGAKLAQDTAEDILGRGESFSSLAFGSSMEPLLCGGIDRVVVSPINGKLKKYDVVLYRKNTKLVLHRIVKVKGESYYIRGDNSFYTDRVDRRQIIGVMTYYYKGDEKKSVQGKKYKLYSFLRLKSWPIRRLFAKMFRKRK